MESNKNDKYDVYVAITGKLVFTGSKAAIALEYKTTPGYVQQVCRESIFFRRRFLIVKHGDPVPAVNLSRARAERLMVREAQLAQERREHDAKDAAADAEDDHEDEEKPLTLDTKQKRSLDVLGWYKNSDAQKEADQAREAEEKEKAKATYTSWNDRHPGVEVVPSKHHGWEMAL